MLEDTTVFSYGSFDENNSAKEIVSRIVRRRYLYLNSCKIFIGARTSRSYRALHGFAFSFHLPNLPFRFLSSSRFAYLCLVKYFGNQNARLVSRVQERPKCFFGRITCWRIGIALHMYMLIYRSSGNLGREKRREK